MAYGLKYWNEFACEDNTFTRVEILQDAYTGLTKKISLSDSPLQIVRGQQGIDKFEPVLGSALTLQLISEYSLQWIEFFTSSDTEYRIDVYKDGAIHWTGYVQTDIYREPYTKGSFTIELTATDGFANLKDVVYAPVATDLENAGVDANDINADYISKELEPDYFTSLNDVLWKIVNITSLYQYGSGVRMVENLEYLPSGSRTTTVDLTKWLINQNAFKSGTTYIKTYDVLRSIGYTFMSRFYQKKALFHFMHINPVRLDRNVLDNTAGGSTEFVNQDSVTVDTIKRFGRELTWVENNQQLEIMPAAKTYSVILSKPNCTRVIFNDPLDEDSILVNGSFNPVVPPGDPNTDVTASTFLYWTYPTVKEFLSIYQSATNVLGFSGLFSYSYYYTGGDPQTYPNRYLFTAKRCGYKISRDSLAFTFSIEIALPSASLADALDFKVTFQCYGLDDNQDPTATVDSFDGTDMQSTVQVITKDNTEAKFKYLKVTYTTPIFVNTSGNNGVIACFGFQQVGTSDVNSKFDIAYYRNAKIELTQDVSIPENETLSITNTGYNVDYDKTLILHSSSGEYEGEIYLDPHCLGYADTGVIFRGVDTVLDPWNDDSQNLEYWNLETSNNEHIAPLIKLNGSVRGDISMDSIVYDSNFPNKKFMPTFILENDKRGTKEIELIELIDYTP